jgi:Mn-dependent DtxR family transcriptional regulator
MDGALAEKPKEANQKMRTANQQTPSPTIEDYLKAIYSLARAESRAVRPTAIAKAMNVSRPTITDTVRRLENDGWIVREGKGVVLTDAGRIQAASVLRRRNIASSFLETVLELPRKEAVTEACRLEHALSLRTASALERFLERSGIALVGDEVWVGHHRAG